MAKALIVEILADAKQFGHELDKAAGKTRSLGKVAGVAGLAIAGGLALGLEKSVKASMDFQQSMQLLTTQAGVSEKQLGSLKQGVLALAGPTATAPDELAKGIYHLASQGLRGQKALDALRIAAEGAKVGQADLEDVTNALGAAMVSGISGAKNLKGAMGSLNATVGAGDMRMQDLADAMGTGILASAKVAGISLNQVNAALAVLGDNNIRGAKAGTLLTSTIRVLGHQSNAGAKALQAMGINSDTLQKKLGTGGLTGAIDYLSERLKVTKVPIYEVRSLLSEAFGGKQATGIKILLGQIVRLHTKLKEVRDGASGFGQAWQQTSQTTQFKFDQMKAAMDSVAVNLGSSLLPAVTAAANAIAVFTGWLSKHTTVAKIMVGVIATLAAGLLALSAATWAVNVAMDANPIGLAIIAVAALTAGLIVLVTHFRQVKEWLASHWPVVAALMLTPIGPIIAVGAAIMALKDHFSTVRAFAMHVWDGIKEVWNNTLGAEIQVIIGLINDLISIAHKAADIIHAIGSAGRAILGGSNNNFKNSPTGGGPRGPLKVPHMAAGGIVTSPMFALIGEKGPEAVVPLDKMQGGGGGVTVHIGHVHGTADAGFARVLARELATQLRGGRAPQLQQAIRAI